jgi:SWI/SNF-related matrix-associated actin-dependent regulator 1 of chromatin subfamily A
MKPTPLPYQEESIELIDRFKGRALLAHDMGLGKTLIALWWLQRNPQFLPALVVCPASIKYVWEAEAKTNLGITPLVIEGQKQIEMNGEKIVVINYDVLSHHLDCLKTRGFKALVVDECQYICNPGTRRTRAVRELARRTKKILAISGTPLKNRPDELFPIVQMLKPSIFPTYIEFVQNYVETQYTPWGLDCSKPKNARQLHKLLRGTCMIRYRKKDVLPELPEKTRRVLPIGMRDEDEYFSARDDFIGWLKTVNPKKVKRAQRAESLVRLVYLKRLAAKLKCLNAVDWANQWLEEYPSEKLILFAVHRKMIRVLQKHVEAKSVTIDGSVKERERKTAVDQFQKDEGTRLFIGNIKAAGTGLTLTASSTTAFVEMSFVPSEHTQAEDRNHRIGQKNKVWIWYLIAANSIEEHLCEILQRKQAVVESILDGGTVDGLDVYTQLIMKMGVMK